jgi:DNA replication protein DnaC
VEQRIKQSKFLILKSLDSFNFTFIPSLNKAQVMKLSRCEFVNRKENVVLLDKSVIGKIHITTGLGMAACQKGLTILFTTATSSSNQKAQAKIFELL